MKTLITITLVLALSTLALAQEKPKPTLAEMRKDLIILNLRLENMQLQYRINKAAREKLKAAIKLTEAKVAASKSTTKTKP